jgi:hypothetical protein
MLVADRQKLEVEEMLAHETSLFGKNQRHLYFFHWKENSRRIVGKYGRDCDNMTIWSKL